MSVRNVSGRTPQGFREESAMCPLYPTRPDPTRPFKDFLQAFIHVVQYLRNRARAATEPSDTHQPHATTPAWMRADR